METLRNTLCDTEQARQLEVLIELHIATCWHEQGERNSKYFYPVIKEWQPQQTIQLLKCSVTGDTLVDAASLKK